MIEIPSVTFNKSVPYAESRPFCCCSLQEHVFNDFFRTHSSVRTVCDYNITNTKYSELYFHWSLVQIRLEGPMCVPIVG